jgi:hypothetical protein
LFALFTVRSPLPNAGADSLRRRKAKKAPFGSPRRSRPCAGAAAHH